MFSKAIYTLTRYSERDMDSSATQITHFLRNLCEMPDYCLSNLQISPTILPNRLLDSDLREYSCNEFLTFALLLNVSIILFLVHFFNEKPGDKA